MNGIDQADVTGRVNLGLSAVLGKATVDAGTI